MKLRQLKNLIDFALAYTVWQMPDGQLFVAKVSQFEYEMSLSRGFNAGCPDTSAVFLCGGGGCPALDTNDGYHEIGDSFIVDNGREQQLFIATGTSFDWGYFTYQADDPIDNQFSNVWGYAADSKNNFLRIPLNRDIFDAYHSKSLKLKIGNLEIRNNELILPDNFAYKNERQFVGKIPNHHSVTFDAGSGSNNAYGTSVSWSHTVASQSDRYLAIGNTCRLTAVSSMTYNGVNLSSATSQTAVDGNTVASYWDLIAPATGSNTAVVNVSGSSAISAIAQSAYGVHQTTPRATNNNTGNDTAPTVTISSATDGAVLTYLGWDNSSASITDTIDAGFILDGSQQTTQYASGNGAHKTGASSVTRTDTLSGTNYWVMLALALAPTAASAITEQEGYRWRNDDGSETTATWAASQDTNDSVAANTNKRLRMLINTTNDLPSSQFQLEYRVQGSSDPWKKVE